MSEEWRPIPGRPEGYYEVSSLGRVRSLDRVVQRRNGVQAFRRGKVLAASLNSCGRPNVILHTPGIRPHSEQVAALVALAFLGPRPEGLSVLHWDDDKLNNRPENLRYGTLSENQYDRVRNGIHNAANKTECKWGHKFTPENTYIYRRTGRRACLKCMRRNNHDRNMRLAEARR